MPNPYRDGTCILCSVVSSTGEPEPPVTFYLDRFGRCTFKVRVLVSGCIFTKSNHRTESAGRRAFYEACEEWRNFSKLHP